MQALLLPLCAAMLHAIAASAAASYRTDSLQCIVLVGLSARCCERWTAQLRSGFSPRALPHLCCLSFFLACSFAFLAAASASCFCFSSAFVCRCFSCRQR